MFAALAIFVSARGFIAAVVSVHHSLSLSKPANKADLYSSFCSSGCSLRRSQIGLASVAPSSEAAFAALYSDDFFMVPTAEGSR